jgi:putative oxidoreductase
MSTAAIAALVVRSGLILLFLPFSALDKVLNFGGAVRQAQEIFRPHALGVAVIGVALAIEIVMSLAIVIGIADRAAALVMAVYCVSTAILFKRFWEPGDFWSNAAGQGRALFWDCLKNISLGAGFLLITIGSDGSGLAGFFAHPLAPSHLYSRQINHE